MLAEQLSDEVEVVVLWNRGSGNLGEYRQALLEDAEGEWVSFVDDDDRIADGYCEKILAALAMNPDYVGFKVAVADLSKKRINPRYRNYLAVHSIRNPRWCQEGSTFLRHVSHLNPIRRDIALKVPFEGTRGEDHSWAELVRPHVKTEVFVDDVLYLYDYTGELSLRGGRRDGRGVRPVLPAGFRFHPQSEV